VDEALGRLEAALGLLEAAVARRLDGERRRSDLEIELQIMQDDRARLAGELDGATAHLRRSEAAVGDVEQRLARAIGAVEGVLGRG
jgi:hypothetical protein